MTYGAGNTLATGLGVGYSESGLVNGDTIASVTLTTNATVSSTSGFWNAGNWTITPSNATGSVLSNYTVTYDKGRLDIAPKAITISAVDGSKTYDSTTDSNLMPTVTGLVKGDKVLDLSESYNSPDVLTATTLSVNHGFITRDGNNGKNYTVTACNGVRRHHPGAGDVERRKDLRLWNSLRAQQLRHRRHDLNRDRAADTNGDDARRQRHG